MKPISLVENFKIPRVVLIHIGARQYLVNVLQGVD